MSFDDYFGTTVSYSQYSVVMLPYKKHEKFDYN